MGLVHAKADELRNAGIAVEIREGRGRGTSERGGEDGRAEGPGDSSPGEALQAYLDDAVAEGAVGRDVARELLEAGREVWKERGEGVSTGEAASAVTTDLRIDSVSVVGFGSFRREVLCPMRGRGVVLLRGTNRDFGSGR